MNTQVVEHRGLLTTFLPRDCQRLLIDGFLLLLYVLIVTIVTFVYVSNEHTFYYWDYSIYHDMTLEKAIYFRELPKYSRNEVLEALKEIWKSTAEDYSDIHTLLIIPFILTFGASRLVYILSITLIYLLPFALVTGAIAAKLIPSHPRIVFWSAALLTLFVPAVWLPTLRGYPDTGSAALIALAILVYLHDSKLRHWWQIVLIGFCIASATLFRRHFVYDGITFFVAITLQALFAFVARVRQRPQEAWHGLFRSSIRIGLTLAATLITMAILGWPFIDRVLHTNFGLLYASYERPFSENLRYYKSYYGWIACILAGLGATAGIRNRVLARPAAIFVVLFAGFSLMQWTFAVKQLGIHYTLHFTLGILLGLVVFVQTAWITLKGRTRTLVLSASSAYLVFNAFIGLAPVDILDNIPIVSTSFGMRELFSANYPPLKRADYDEIVRLIDYLRTTASAKEPIYVAASSDILNDNLLWHAERTLYEKVMSYSVHEFWQNRELTILWIPFADSRDYYPLEKLLESQYVVIATPFQFHMRPEEQDVLKVVLDAFAENWECAQDFTRLPVQFSLPDGVVVHVYKRLRTTSLQTVLRTLKDMQDYVGTRPGGQPSWIKVSGIFGSYITRNRDNSHNIVTNSIYDPKASTASFLYLDGVLDQAAITGDLINYDNTCIAGLSFNAAAIDARGKVISTTDLMPLPDDASDFWLSLQTRDSAYLLLNISANYGENDSVDHCWLIIRNLVVSAR